MISYIVYFLRFLTFCVIGHDNYCCTDDVMHPWSFYHAAQCTLVHLRGLGIACRPSVCLSVTLVSCDHIGWNSWKIISRLISIGFLLSVDPISWIYSEWNISKMRRIHDFGTFPTPINLWYLFNVIIFMGMIQPCGCLFILVTDYLFQSIVSVVGLVLRVRFDSLQTTTTKHLYIFRHFAGH